MDKIKKIVQLANIIYRYWHGTIVDEERKVLDAWLVEDMHHQEMLEEFSQSEFWEQKVIEHELFNFKDGFNRFLKGKKQIDNRRWMRRWRSIAALFIIGCGVALALWLRHQQTDELPIPQSLADFKPGQFKATLVLADGKQLLLNDTLQEQLAQYTAQVNIKEGVLNYRSGDTAQKLVYNLMQTPRGGEYRLELADGTRVWLNAETEFKYPVEFVGDSREVWLKGEAYFEVTKDTTRPFIVKTPQIHVQVLGTSFNVKAYSDETEQTTLVEGSVKVQAGKLEQVIFPGEQLSFYQGVLKVREVEVGAYIAWKNQRFSFTDDLLEEVLLKLERWYDVEFFIPNSTIRACRFTGNLPKYESLEKVLKKLELTTHIHFVQRGRTVVVEADQ